MKLLGSLLRNISVRERLKKQGKTNFWDSMNHAIDGINYTSGHEKNFKIEMVVLLLTIASVLSLELINTSIERCVDLVTKEISRTC